MAAPAVVEAPCTWRHLPLLVATTSPNGTAVIAWTGDPLIQPQKIASSRGSPAEGKEGSSETRVRVAMRMRSQFKGSVEKWEGDCGVLNTLTQGFGYRNQQLAFGPN